MRKTHARRFTRSRFHYSFFSPFKCPPFESPPSRCHPFNALSVPHPFTASAAQSLSRQTLSRMPGLPRPSVLATSWEMTKLGLAGQEPLLGDYREFQDVRETGVKPPDTEFRLRGMADLTITNLANPRANQALHTMDAVLRRGVPWAPSDRAACAV